MKSVQIPEDLFCDLFLYHVIGIDEPGARIKTALEQKMEALKRQALSTQYRTSETEAHREEARQQYLDSAGILRNFRW